MMDHAGRRLLLFNKVSEIFLILGAGCINPTKEVFNVIMMNSDIESLAAQPEV